MRARLKRGDTRAQGEREFSSPRAGQGPRSHARSPAPVPDGLPADQASNEDMEAFDAELEALDVAEDAGLDDIVETIVAPFGKDGPRFYRSARSEAVGRREAMRTYLEVLMADDSATLKERLEASEALEAMALEDLSPRRLWSEVR
jgi:hypothetical protein